MGISLGKLNMEKETQTRDIELENIVGRKAEFQVERLRDRVVSRIDSMYPSTINKKASTYVFKSNDTWIKISLNVEKITTGKTNEIQGEIQETE